MEFIKKYLINVMVAIMAILALESCSCSTEHVGLDKKLASVISDDTPMVWVGNIDRFFEQTDIELSGDKVELPEYMQNAINILSQRNRGDLNRMIKSVDGVDYNNVVIGTDLTGNTTLIFVMSVVDADDFAKSLTRLNNKFKIGERGGYKSVGDKNQEIMIKDNLVYAVFNQQGGLTGMKAVDAINQWHDRAVQKPLASWKVDYLSQNKVMTSLISMKGGFETLSRESVSLAKIMTTEGMMKELSTGFIGMTGDLDGSTASYTINLLDRDGKGIKNEYAGKFDTALMSYASPTDAVGAGFCANTKGYEAMLSNLRSLKDETSLEGRRSLLQSASMLDALLQCAEIANDYLGDGGVFVAAGLRKGVSLAHFDTDWTKNIHFVAAAAIKPGKINDAYNRVMTMLRGGLGDKLTVDDSTVDGMKVSRITIRYQSDYDFLADREVYDEENVYMAIDGNNLVVSNDVIMKSKSALLDKDMFSSSYFAIQGVVSDKLPIIAQLGIKMGADVRVEAKDDGLSIRVSLTNTDDKIIPALCKFFVGGSTSNGGKAFLE